VHEWEIGFDGFKLFFDTFLFISEIVCLAYIEGIQSGIAQIILGMLPRM